MTENTDHSVRLVSRREAMQGAGVALGSLVASGTLTDTVMAQSGGPSDEISGIVEDESGAVEGATVVAVPHDTSLAALETTTDANGEYIFEQSDLHEDSNLYHVIARDGIESDPRRGAPNYPFIAAEGPTAIPDSGNLQVQYIADSYGDSYNDGETITSDFSDESGNGNDGTVIGNPVYRESTSNGQPGVEFDGVDDAFDTGVPADTANPRTRYAVYEADASSNIYTIYGADDGGNTIDAYAAIEPGSRWLGGWGDAFYTGGSPSADTFYIQSTVADASDSSYSLFIDGGQVVSDNYSTSGDPGPTAYLGARQRPSDVLQYFDGVICEYLDYAAAHDSSTRASVESYLNDKYGVF